MTKALTVHATKFSASAAAKIAAAGGTAVVVLSVRSAGRLRPMTESWPAADRLRSIRRRLPSRGSGLCRYP